MDDDALQIVRVAVNQGIFDPERILRRIQLYFEYSPEWEPPTLEQVQAAIDTFK